MRGGFGLGFGRRTRVRRPSFLPGATLDMGFARGAYLGATRSQLSTTRASTGYAQNSAGVWVPYSSGVARLNDRGLTNENTKTNNVRNDTMQGATLGVVGSGGTLPTNWAFFCPGLTMTVVAKGTINGIDYIDIRLSGTTAGTFANINFDTSVGIAALNGQTWVGSVFLATIGGGWTNINDLALRNGVNDSGGVYLGENWSPALYTSASITNNISRLVEKGTIANASASFVSPYIQIRYNNNSAVDLTLRIGWPCLVQGQFADTPIPTSGVAATRMTDINELTGTNFSSWFTNNSAFTLYYEGVWDGALNTGYYPGLIAIYGSGGQSQNTCAVAIDQATGKINLFNRVAGVQVNTANSVVALTSGTPFKLAIRFQTNEMAFSLNGAGVVSQGGTWTIPTLTTARIGGGDAAADGRTLRCAYKPGADNDTNLRALAS